MQPITGPNKYIQNSNRFIKISPFLYFKSKTMRNKRQEREENKRHD